MHLVVLDFCESTSASCDRIVAALHEARWAGYISITSFILHKKVFR
jgi:hypothetical protein